MDYNRSIGRLRDFSSTYACKTFIIPMNTLCNVAADFSLHTGMPHPEAA